MEYPSVIRLTVTDAHIINGVRRNCKMCPIALALRDAGYGESMVTYHEVLMSNGMVYITDSAACFVISEFDEAFTDIQTPVYINLTRKN